MTLLDRSAVLAEELSAIHAESRTDRLAYREAKIIRDKVAVLLKQSVNEVRACGQHLFYRNKERRRGCASTYLRKINKANRQPAETHAKTLHSLIHLGAYPFAILTIMQLWGIHPTVA